MFTCPNCESDYPNAGRCPELPCGGITLLPSAILHPLFAAEFHLEHTGGNCTAFVRHLFAYNRETGKREMTEEFEMITLADDPSIPTELSDKVSIGYYGDDPFEASWEIRDYTLGDVIAALSDPAVNEYSLLILRVLNLTRSICSLCSNLTPSGISLCESCGAEIAED